MFGLVFIAFIFPILEGISSVILTALELLKGKMNIKIAEINFRIQRIATQEEEEPHRAIGFVLPNNDEEYEDDEDEDI